MTHSVPAEPAAPAASVIPEAITRFCEFYRQLSTDTLSQLPAVYASEIEFHDPAHQIQGLDNLRRYFNHMLANISHCQFEIERLNTTHNEAYIHWQMQFAHPRLKAGQIITVPGVSYLRFSQQTQLIIYHRDYMDMGAMLYEHLPLLGRVIRAIKQRLAV